jgi:glycosyltransferase involved in cell wall biosynthesis
MGLIRAFKQAFGDHKNVLLLIKSMHADSEAVLQQLRTEIQTANVRIFNDVLPRQAAHSLMQISDCYVSLHRSEGFGLTLSEAMMCGKPVIATGYSGNIDFMTEDNSFLVPYRLIEIERDHGPYKKGCVWADPDLNRASEFMLQVFEDRAGTREVAQRGRAHVAAKLHPRVIAESVARKLNSLSTPV